MEQEFQRIDGARLQGCGMVWKPEDVTTSKKAEMNALSKDTVCTVFGQVDGGLGPHIQFAVKERGPRWRKARDEGQTVLRNSRWPFAGKLGFLGGAMAGLEGGRHSKSRKAVEEGDDP